MSVLIVIPTVTGREAQLALCTEAYKRTCPEGKTFILKDKPTCAEVWNYGAWWARYVEAADYVHMTADDLIPHDGWYEAAIETVEAGYLPGALIYRPDGSVESYGNQLQDEWSELPGGSVPFCYSDQWVMIPNIHYWSDNAYDHAQQEINGQIFVARKDYAFTHHTAQAGRKGLCDKERLIYEEWAESL